MTALQIPQLVRHWRRDFIIRDALIVGAVTLAAAAIALWWSPPVEVATAAAATFVIALSARLMTSTRWRVDADRFTRHLDRMFPQLEESSTLLLRSPETLTVVERLQQQRVARAAETLQLSAAAPRGLLRLPLWGLALALVLFAGTLIWRSTRGGEGRSAAVAALAQEMASHASQAPVVPKITEAEMVIAPPAYTGRPERRVPGLNAEAEEGATVTWRIALDAPIQNARLVFGERDALPLRREGDTLTASRTLSETLLYHASATLPGGTVWNSTELHPLKVIKDQAPSVKIIEPTLPRTLIDPPTTVARITVHISDDYGVADAHLIGTVAKGTGEAVKFREQQIAFDTFEPLGDEPNGRRFTKAVDLAALRMEPGDELYFYVEARDNREPANNSTRSETRFIVLRGPQQEVSTLAAGLAGVNLVPEYFRSQRQIIIDTEKLIAEQQTLTESEFKRRANDLGIDQQLLRQRYGQFLGEDEHYEGDGHDHSSGADAAPLTHADVVKQFGHQHDSEDEATFFQGEAKATMRDALAAMWQAEGFLRTARPADALAPENRALAILKELQQTDRAYVQRVGFEAAPLNIAERRLRGDVEGVPERAVTPVVQPQSDDTVAAVRHLLKVGPVVAAVVPLPAEQIEALRRVESGLTKAATDDPQVFMAALQALRRLASAQVASTNDWEQLERALLRMLPPQHPLPHRPADVAPAMAQPYFDALE
jgi:hypothetical protein